MKRILILGGYGATGVCLSRLLLEHTDAHITIAGRNIEKTEKAAAHLGGASTNGRIAAAMADAEDHSVTAEGVPWC